MKTSTKKYLFGLSILTCLIVGAWIINPIMAWLNPSVHYPGRSSHSAYVGRNITNYTQDATSIIIGEVKELSDPYIVQNGTISQQNLVIHIEEVLKGDPNMTKITLLIDDEYAVEKSENGKVKFIPLKGKNVYKPGEKILLFVGQLTEGHYVPYAGPYGKYLIDEQQNVSSIGNFKMSLKELKSQIKEALKLPPKEHIVRPVEKMI